MFEQLAHDIKIVIQAPFEEPEIKMSLIHGMIDKTIQRKILPKPPQTERSMVEIPVNWNREEEN